MEPESGVVAGPGGPQLNAPAGLCLDQETSLWGFRGRITRKEFWIRLAFALAVPVVFSMILFLLPIGPGFNGSSEIPRALEILAILVGVPFVFFLLWFSLATQVKRWHDVGLSGWMVLLNLVPYLGLINVLAAGCIGGTKGSNRYGADPTSPENRTPNDAPAV